MNPYAHELRHLLRTKTVIAVAVVAVLAGTLGYLTIESSTSELAVTGAGFWYYSAAAYHVDLWAFDPAGTPVSGVTVTLNVSEPPAYPYSSPSDVVYLGRETTGTTGEVEFTVPLPPGEYSVVVSARYAAVPGALMEGEFTSGFAFTNQTSPTAQFLGDPLNVVTENFYSTKQDYLVVWGSSGGVAPSGDRVVACSFVYTQGNFSTPFPANCSGEALDSYQVLGSLTSYLTTVPIPQFSSPAVSFPQIFLSFVEVVNATGAVVYSAGAGGICVGGAACTISGSADPGPSILGSFATDLSLFLPLMALMMAYWTYARPRLTGTFEPILARPVSRKGLFLVRYGTLALLLAAAAAAEVLLLDLGLSLILREPLPGSFAAPLVGSLVVAGVGFAGLVYLSSHAFRSTGPVLGLGIALLLVFSLFWLELVALVTLAATGGLFSGQFEGILFTSQLFAPPQFPSLVVELLTGSPELGVSGGSITGTTAAIVAGIAGALWLAVPLLVSYERAIHRD